MQPLHYSQRDLRCTGDNWPAQGHKILQGVDPTLQAIFLVHCFLWCHDCPEIGAIAASGDHRHLLILSGRSLAHLQLGSPLLPTGSIIPASTTIKPWSAEDPAVNWWSALPPPTPSLQLPSPLTFLGPPRLSSLGHLTQDRAPLSGMLYPFPRPF